ncbi:MAG: hypothetical protein LBB82_03790 [Treponema sp.]|jgi:hypothetical protein|nr:hypothetical protein [Treponema sp.]
MKKFCIAALVAVTASLAAHALEIHIAPLYFINEAEDRGQSYNNYHNRLALALRNYEEGVELRFTTLGTLAGRNPPQSLTDALSAAKSARADYLLYGFVAEKEFSVQAEIRLLDWKNRRVAASFFAMDEKGEEDRMFADLARKILEYIDSHYGIPLIEDPVQFMHAVLPLRLGYWTPAGDWFPLLFGTVDFIAGMTLAPRDHLFVSNGYVYYLSTGLLINYRLGTGKEYKAYDHGLSFMAPLIIHQKLNAENEIFYGAGLSYSFDFLNIEEPYRDREVQRYNAVGFFFTSGYRYWWKENLALVIDNRLDLRGYGTPLMSFSLNFGIDWKFYTREVVKKW